MPDGLASNDAARADAQSHLGEIEQIKQLKARCFRFMDTKRWQEWRSLFTDDMTY